MALCAGRVSVITLAASTAAAYATGAGASTRHTPNTRFAQVWSP